ncbi:hypothetical protein GOV07_04180 [Candidatus Woesearchaeota archaeon]|nr:hypothetical protein [Candidatus Woesearchaeota archaeon]
MEGMITFWLGVIAALFILLHMPSCDAHWADKFGAVGKWLRRYHTPTLRIATIFALVHLLLIVFGFVFGIWL